MDSLTDHTDMIMLTLLAFCLGYFITRSWQIAQAIERNNP